MGVSAGKVVGDEGESTGISTINAGKKSDDDEDFNWEDYEEHGGGIQGGDVPQYQQTIDEIRITEQVKQNLAHQRHKRLHARQELDGSISQGALDTVGKDVNTLSSGVSDIPAITTTPVVSSPLDLSTLSIVPPSSLAPSLATDINTSLPIGSSLQTFLSSTPPPSPAQTSPGMTIPPTTTTSSSASTTTPTPSRNSSNTGPSTTVTSYWTSLTFKNNGTSISNTRSSTVTVDGTVIVFTFPPNTRGSNFSTHTGNSSTRSSTSSSSTLSSNSTTTSTTSTTPSSPLTTELWASATGVGGGAGGGYVVPTGNTVIAPSATSAQASAGGSSPPVSPSLLGGVLGGVAGLAFVLVAVLYLIRRHRREAAATARDEAGYGGPLGSSGGQMVQRSGITPFALAGSFFARHPRASRASQSSEAPTVPSETGFYKISGRKLDPVLGGPRPGYGSTRSAGGSSFYPDEDGGGTGGGGGGSWVAGGSGTITSTPSVAGPSRYSSMTAASASPTASSAPMSLITPIPTPVPATHPHVGSSMAPPPPRIPEEAAESDTDSTHKLPRPPPFPRQLSAISVGSVGKDGVGRSLPSHDGSRASRFTEDIV